MDLQHLDNKAMNTEQEMDETCADCNSIKLKRNFIKAHGKLGKALLNKYGLERAIEVMSEHGEQK
jgi:hypothetical protein